MNSKISATKVYFSSTQESDTRGSGSACGWGGSLPCVDSHNLAAGAAAKQDAGFQGNFGHQHQMAKEEQHEVAHLGAFYGPIHTYLLLTFLWVEPCPLTICKFKRGWETQWSFVPRGENKQVFLNS